MVSFDDVSHIPVISRLLGEGYHLAAIYPYTSLHGDALYWRVRLQHPSKGKQIRPIRRAAGDVFEAKEPDDIKHGLKPLYGLHLLLLHTTALVWIVEGEKCADALNAAFERWGVQSEHIALTSGSATSADKADWHPLHGRSVTIWPDNDASGLDYAAAATTSLEAIGCAVDCIAAGELWLGDGEDCVEWLATNSAATIADALALPKQQPTPPDNEMRIICMSNVEMKPINWLWKKRIACGKATVIAGNPGLGKSQLTANLAATVSRGLMWPEDGLPNCLQGHVVFLSAEDDAADTIKPRLIAAGADASKCHIIEAIRTKTHDGRDSERSFDLSRDVERLGMALGQIGNVRLVIIDPITAYLGETDSHNNADMRGVLAPLSAMVARYEVALLLITHLNKSTGQDMLARVMGSIGLIAAARAGYVVMKDEKQPELLYFLPIKNNVGNDKDGFSFMIEGVELEGGIHTSRINWQAGTVNTHEILNPPPEEKPAPANKTQDWLKNLLTEPMLSNDIYIEAEGAGFSKGKLFRAAEALEVQKKKLGMKGSWQWSLPKRDAYGNIVKDAEDVEECEDSAFETVAPELFKDEDQLREIWSKPDTRKELLDKLSEKGFGAEQLAEIKLIINAEKSDLFDVLAHIAFALSPITRQERAATQKNHIFAHYDDKQREFLDFVLSQYVKEGEKELDKAKLPSLLELKYQAVSDATEKLGSIASIRGVFMGFQQYLYNR